MKALTSEQQAFAEQNYGLLQDFITKHELDSDYYGALAQRYLSTVARYTTDGSLQQYAFSTVVWYHLRSELSNIARRMEKETYEVPIEYIEDICADTDPTIDAAMWNEIERILTFKQCEVVLLRNQGFNNREIADLCGISCKAVEKRFARIRKKLKRNDYKEI